MHTQTENSITTLTKNTYNLVCIQVSCELSTPRTRIYELNQAILDLAQCTANPEIEDGSKTGNTYYSACIHDNWIFSTATSQGIRLENSFELVFSICAMLANTGNSSWRLKIGSSYNSFMHSRYVSTSFQRFHPGFREPCIEMNFRTIFSTSLLNFIKIVLVDSKL